MHDKALLSGSLRLINLPDLFQMLGGNNNTGILEINGETFPDQARIYFVEGNPVNAVCGRSSGLEALYGLFGWTDGSFRFYPQPVTIGRAIHKNRMEIILDAMRMLDEGLVPTLGAAAASNDGSEGLPLADNNRNGTLKVIKGSLVNFKYIMDEEEFDDGEIIVRQGGHGKWMWVILEGKVRITRETRRERVSVAILGEGSTIGTLTCLTWGEHIRTATATAMGRVLLGVLDTERLSEDYTRLSPPFRSLLLSLNTRLVGATDMAVHAFMDIDKGRRIESSGEHLLEEDFEREQVFLVREGEAQLIRKLSCGYLPILTLKKGDMFGYMPSMEIGEELLGASVLPSGPFRVESMEVDRFYREYEGLSNAFKGLIHNMGVCVSMTAHLTVKGMD